MENERMVKSKDLRIGNFVYLFYDENEQSILKFEFDSGWNFDYIKPIPLTEEWLIKLGFSVREGGYAHLNLPNKGAYIYINHSGSGIAIENDETELSYQIELKYVHQVQNLFHSLTNIDL